MARYDPGRRYVLHAREKHGGRFLDATTEAAFHRSAVKLLTERLKAEQYEYLRSAGLTEPDLTKGQTALLLPGKVRETAFKQWEKYERALLENAENERLYGKIVKAVKEKDGSAAWDALELCRDGEYDWVELEELET